MFICCSEIVVTEHLSITVYASGMCAVSMELWHRCWNTHNAPHMSQLECQKQQQQHSPKETTLKWSTFFFRSHRHTSKLRSCGHWTTRWSGECCGQPSPDYEHIFREMHSNSETHSGDSPQLCASKQWQMLKSYIVVIACAQWIWRWWYDWWVVRHYQRVAHYARLCVWMNIR